MIALALAAVVQSVAPFQPPLDRPIAYSFTEARDSGTGVQLFTIDRCVTFRRREGGFAAEVETLRVIGSGKPGMARTFEAAMRAMVGLRVMLTLDAAGHVIGVADRERIWKAQVEGLAAAVAAPAGSAKAATVATLLAPLRAMPPAQQQERIGEMLTPLIGSDVLASGARSPRSVSVPAQGRDGSQAVLTGTETSVRERDGMLRFDRSVADATSRVHLLRRVDPATGLVRETIETSDLSVGGARLRITRTTTVTS